ncbi:stalk domain-containing protein [Caldisericum exile]|nr:stalk domain-containing protein [Caldisericum exile]
MKKIPVLIILLSLLIPNIAFGKTLYWRSLFSKAGFVSSPNYFNPVKGIEIDPNNSNVVYLATWGNGVLKSIDGGKHFDPINNGLTELNTYVVKVDGNNPKIVYAGTATGVFVSYDGGASFNLLQDLRLSVTSVEFGVGILYAGILNDGINAGLYKFKDNKWIEVGLSDKDVLSIARLNTSTLLLGTSDGLYSFDEKSSTFKFLGFQNLTVNSIAVSKKKIVIGTSDGVFASDIDPIYFVSLNNINVLLSSGNFLSVAIYKDNPYKVIVGNDKGSLFRFDLNMGSFERLQVRANCIYSLYVKSDDTIFVGTENAFLWSDNNGQSFKGFALTITGGEMQIDPQNLNIIYVGSDNGLYKSVDGGVNFINLGFVGNRVFSVAINPNDDRELFVGTYLGLYHSIDYGESFVELKQFSGYSVTFVAIVPQTQIIFAGSEIGVFVSQDHGITWTKSLSIKEGDFILYIAIDPTNSNIVYVASFIDGLYKTYDGGKTWQYLGHDDFVISSISIYKGNPNVIYISTLGSIYKSSDGGKTLTKIFNISGGSSGWYVFKDVLVSSYNPNLVFAVGDFIVYGTNRVTGLPEIAYDEPILFRTIDSGEHWEKLDLPNTIESNNAIYYDEKTNTALLLTGIGILHYDFTHMKYYFYSEGFSEEYIRVVRTFDDALFVGTNSGNIGKSFDGGKTFEFHAKFDVPVLSLFQSKTNPNFIYAGTSMGLLVSTDFGSSWKRYFSGMVYAITGFNLNGKDIIFLGTDSGIFEINGYLDTGKLIYDGVSTALYYYDGKLYAGTDRGLLVSNDFENFELLKDIGSTINTIAIFDGSLFVGTNDGLYVIDRDSVNSILKDSVIFDMVYQNGTIYLATDSGVLILNKDLSYTSINNGLTSYYATSITVSKNGDIFLGTDGGGLFKLESRSTVKVSASLGGKVEPSGEFEMSPTEEKEFIITPNSGFRLKDVLINGNSYLTNAKDLGNGTYTLKLSGIYDDSTLQVNFEPITFVIKTYAHLGGSITPGETLSVSFGSSQTFTITPDSGYKIKDVLVDGKSVGAVSTYTFNNITSDHTIEAFFEKKTTTIALQIGSSSFTVDGDIRTLDSPPVIKNGRTLLPIRAIIEALGGTVSWDATTRKVTISLGNNTIELWIGRSIAKVNGTDTPIDSTNPKVVPEIINGRTMIPLRFVAESLGADVQWDGTTKTITITYGG